MQPLKTPRQLVQEATVAANLAGDEWMEKAKPKYVPVNAISGYRYPPMLDLCGNAHVRFTDRRTKNYKDFVKAELVRASGNGVVEINHKYQFRQEHGLLLACAKAALAVMEANGISNLRIWDWID